jgi:hypothetical protein
MAACVAIGATAAAAEVNAGDAATVTGWLCAASIRAVTGWLWAASIRAVTVASGTVAVGVPAPTRVRVMSSLRARLEGGVVTASPRCVATPVDRVGSAGRETPWSSSGSSPVGGVAVSIGVPAAESGVESTACPSALGGVVAPGPASLAVCAVGDVGSRFGPVRFVPPVRPAEVSGAGVRMLDGAAPEVEPVSVATGLDGGASSSAQAIGLADTAAPIPSATANVPTLPTKLA